MNKKNCQIDLDLTDEVFKFVTKGLGLDKLWTQKYVAIGVWLEKKLIAGIVFNEIRPRRDVWLTIYTTDKRWCNKRVLRAIFNIAFNFLECCRASVRIDNTNTKSQRLVEGLGFKKEGVLRQFEDNGHDSFIYSMLKTECQWRTKENE